MLVAVPPLQFERPVIVHAVTRDAAQDGAVLTVDVICDVIDYYHIIQYRLGTVNSKFHFIQSFCEMFSHRYSYFHLIRRKFLPTNDCELTVPDL